MFFPFLFLVVFPNQHIYVVVVINDYKVGRGSRYSISCNISLMINIDPTFSTLSLNLLSRLLTANQPVSYVMVKAVHIDLYITKSRECRFVFYEDYFGLSIPRHGARKKLETFSFFTKLFIQYRSCKPFSSTSEAEAYFLLIYSNGMSLNGTPHWMIRILLLTGLHKKRLYCILILRTPHFTTDYAKIRWWWEKKHNLSKSSFSSKIQLEKCIF